jgi:asparagine synthase (glutamine-hydrolysing)
MCGIAGVYRFDTKPVDLALLQRMTKVIAHRGPDDEGHWIGNNVGLGNRRLSIIDLSPRGKQPMCNEDRTIWATYNGETYNFQDLRSDLICKGHRFNSNTDTEAIIHLYEEEGVECLNQLRGMYGFALWDSAKRRLLLTRDRLGIKPLFYYSDHEKLLFGSEMKCILQDSSIKRKVDLKTLHHYLSFNYVPAPCTMFENIRQLLPGHYLIVEDGTVSVHEYWDLKFSREDGHDERYYRDQLDEHLADSVEKMLISDVPFGVFLSGGIDSSTITYYMSQILQQPVKTFSIGFEEESYNELENARAVAKHCKTDHHERVIHPNDLESLLPVLVRHAEEPLADASMVPLYYVSKLAREHVKMVLCGDGADEILAGYETYQANIFAGMYRKIPFAVRRRLVSPLVEKLPVSDKKISFEYKAKRFAHGAEHSPERAHFHWRIIFDEAEKRKLYSDCALKQLNGLDTFSETLAPYFARSDAEESLDRFLYVDTRFYLPNDMLVKVDRMSMANSLEVRVPFLDERVVEFLATVPSSLKLKNLTQKKYLLKRVMDGRLPSKIINQKKRGFNIPVGLWLKTKLKDFLMSTLSKERLCRIGLFNVDYIHSIMNEHFEGRRDYGYQLWGLMIFSLWWQAFIEESAQ